MSTGPAQPPPPVKVSNIEPPKGPTRPTEIIVYGQSMLFYWWPVWVCGYLMALLTYWNDSRVGIFPKGSVYKEKAVQDEKGKDRDAVVLPADTKMPGRIGEDYKNDTELWERMHPSKNMGVIFTVILFLCILITSVPLRGLASVVAILTIVALTLVLALFDAWEGIFAALGKLAIHQNLGAYVFFSTILFIAWVLTTFVFDRMNWWRITPGQITHEYWLRGGQTSFDTEGMAFKKLQDDLFRHYGLGGRWLGLGTGDLIMYPMMQAGAAGSSRLELEVNNVLRIDKILDDIQAMIAAKPETPGKYM